MTDVDVGQGVRLDWAERMSDRCSPILVREVQQALSGRAFLGTLASAVVTVVILALVFAWFGQDDERAGREAFAWCVACLSPIVILIVPLQSFASMRQEVSGGTAEQLLMTRLRPSRIVLGKALAGLAQFVLFLGVFAPLMALTFLLRGVDVPTIAITLLFAVLSSVAANVFAIAMASVGGSRVVQQAMQALASAGLFIGTFAAMAGAYELPREIGRLVSAPDFWLIMTSIAGAYVVGTWLFAMIATASLAHAYENRSSPFRGFALGMLLLLGAWLLMVMEPRHLDEAPGFLSMFFALCLMPFWLWAASEEPGLSPRVRTLVPRSRLLALAAAPFLPGGNRGLVYCALLAAVGVGVGFVVPWLAGQPVDREAGLACALAWMYLPILALLARAIRSRLPSGRKYSLFAFSGTLLAVLLFSILPIVVHLFADDRIDRWHVGHVLDPFFTVAEGTRRSSDAIFFLTPIAGVCLLLSIPWMIRGIREVTDASRARPRRVRAD